MLGGPLNYLKDILFPVFCVQCGKEGEWWCDCCAGKSKIVLITRCPACDVENGTGATCENCKAVSRLDGVMALFNYREGEPLAVLIQKFKYSYVTDIAAIWKKMTEKIVWVENFLPIPQPIIIPVPLHPRRERERGYNQAAILSQIFSEAMWGIPVSLNQLTRERYTAQQVKLTREERLKNTAGAFDWRGADVPAEAILVDDVYTTGATMQECAKVLKRNGAKKVWGFVLGRG